jgi:hypothetical protein
MQTLAVTEPGKVAPAMEAMWRGAGLTPDRLDSPTGAPQRADEAGPTDP